MGHWGLAEEQLTTEAHKNGPWLSLHKNQGSIRHHVALAVPPLHIAPHVFNPSIPLFYPSNSTVGLELAETGWCREAGW
jgi:hypothetical protein